MLGQTRLVSKIDSEIKASTRQWEDEHTFYYLQDHIGTANFITTYEGEIFQVTEYTPYGERRIERSETKSYAYYLPYRFAGKPLDEETGWYYFGARYYDPKYQIWTTSDPALSDYFSDTQKGEGGVFNHINLNTYHYAGNNPIKYVDPDGNSIWSSVLQFASGVGVILGTLAEDILTGGVGIADDPFTLAVLVGLITAAFASSASSASPRMPSSNNNSSNSGNKNDDNDGNGGKHGNADHNTTIREKVKELKSEGLDNIRMNQQQVDRNGNKVGSNRPDLQ